MPPTNEPELKNGCLDLAKTYPIEFIEEVLNRGNRDDKNNLIDRWNQIRSANTAANLVQYATLIGSGNLVASSGDKVIITFGSSAICNRLMKPATKVFGREILKNAFKREIDFLALPGDVFQAISDEFMTAWKQGKRNIKLSPIVCPDLRDVSQEMDEKAGFTEQKVVTDALNVFGDLVKIKK